MTFDELLEKVSDRMRLARIDEWTVAYRKGWPFAGSAYHFHHRDHWHIAAKSTSQLLVRIDAWLMSTPASPFDGVNLISMGGPA